MSAAESPSSWATFWIRASRSAADSATARSKRSISAGDLAGMVERLLLDRAEDRLHPVGDAHHDTRTHADSFTHDDPVSRFSMADRHPGHPTSERIRPGRRGSTGSRPEDIGRSRPVPISRDRASRAPRSSSSEVVGRGNSASKVQAGSIASGNHHSNFRTGTRVVRHFSPLAGDDLPGDRVYRRRRRVYIPLEPTPCGTPPTTGRPRAPSSGSAEAIRGRRDGRCRIVPEPARPAAVNP